MSPQSNLGSRHVLWILSDAFISRVPWVLPPPCFQMVTKQGGGKTQNAQNHPKIFRLRRKTPKMVTKQGGG